MFSQASVILFMGGGGTRAGKGGMYGRGGMHGGVWQRGHASQGGHVWQERRPLQRTVRILLECILVSRKKLNSLCFVDIRSTTEIYIFHKRSFSREHLIIRVHCSKIFLLIFTWDSNLVFCYLMSTFLYICIIQIGQPVKNTTDSST